MTDIQDNLPQILEAAIFAAGEPLSVAKLQMLFEEDQRPEVEVIEAALVLIEETMQHRGVSLVKVGSGYRFQSKADYAPWLQRLWEKKPPRYSRALLETLALVVYQQPITRGEIEDVRGVAVSTHIIKTLMEREWVKIVGHRDVPGKPALLATTKDFLDYFNLSSLSELPALESLMNFEELEKRLKGDINFAEQGITKEHLEGQLELEALEISDEEASVVEAGSEDAAVAEDEAPVVESGSDAAEVSEKAALVVEAESEEAEALEDEASVVEGESEEGEVSEQEALVVEAESGESDVSEKDVPAVETESVEGDEALVEPEEEVAAEEPAADAAVDADLEAGDEEVDCQQRTEATELVAE